MKIYAYNDKIMDFGGKWMEHTDQPVPPTPSLPPYTIRFKYQESATPEFSTGTLTQVSSSPNIWDLTYENNNWSYLCNYQAVIEIIGANTSNVTNMAYMFRGCTSLTSVSLFDASNVRDMSAMFQDCSSLTSVPLFDTSNVTLMNNMFQNCASLMSVPLFDTSNVRGMSAMFQDCGSLTTVPLFDTSKVTSMYSMFDGCTNVQSGALALYQQASTQAIPPTYHNDTFYNCGSNTVTGRAELDEIPEDWGGNALPDDLPIG